MTSIGPRPSVSVVVPCYKYGQYVLQTVTSILRNEHVDIDVLVIDDCSPDDSWQVVQALPRFDTRVRVVRNERNQGLTATANDGLEQAKGDYVVLLSADDALAPGWLDRGVDLLERTPHATFVKGPVRVFEGPHLPSLRKQRDIRSVVWPGRDWIAKSCDQGVTDVRSPEVIVRNSAQRLAGGYNPKVPYSSDMEMWLRLASIGDVIEVTGPVSAFYRFHPSNMSRGKDLLGVGELDSNDDAFDEWYAGVGSQVEGADELMKRAQHALAVMAVGKAPRAFLEDPPMFERLCAFALEKDLLWAAPEVAKLRQRFTSPLAVRARDRLTPVTEAVTSTRRKVPHLRARAGAYTAWVNDRLGTTDHDATGTKGARTLIATEGMWCCETDLAGDGAIRSVAPQEPGHATARVLVRLHGEPLGYVTLPAVDGDVDREQLLRVVWARWSADVNEHLAEEGLPPRTTLGPDDVPLPAATASCPNHVEADESVSVVVCTHNRSTILTRCLAGLQALTYPNLEIIVVDNAPSDGSTRAVVEKVMAEDDRFRYVVEPRAGLSYARNKGLAAATGKYLAYTDDDVSVDPGWIEGLVRGFRRRPDIGCVTGLVCTASVNTAAEAYFDARASSWSTRPRPEIFDMHGARREGALYPYSAGIYGTGANFAFDRAFLTSTNGFDEALGAGARTRGGEDLDAFVTTLLEGRAIAYEPSAIVWHHHRAGRDELLRQLYGYGTGFAAFIAKTIARPSTRWDVVQRVPQGLQKIVKIRSDTKHALGQEIESPRGAALVEFAGYAAGPYLYWRAKRDNRKR